MEYNFTTIRKRYGTGSFKWQQMSDNGVRPEEDIIPFSVADMELETAPAIKEARHLIGKPAVPGRKNAITGRPNRNGSALPMGWWMLSSRR